MSKRISLTSFRRRVRAWLETQHRSAANWLNHRVDRYSNRALFIAWLVFSILGTGLSLRILLHTLSPPHTTTAIQHH